MKSRPLFVRYRLNYDSDFVHLYKLKKYFFLIQPFCVESDLFFALL